MPAERTTEMRSRGPRRGAKPVTATSLQAAAAAYVARYDASSSRLRAVLMRRVLKARRDGAPIIADVEAAIDAVVARHVGAGIVDDAGYAGRKVASLHRRGLSVRLIRDKLKREGIGRDDVDHAIDATRADLAIDREHLDLHAAVAFARRRRLGPFRTAAERDERRTRDLAAMGRAGFAFDLARRVIDSEDPDALLAQEHAP
ncbi:MAG TPA: RecX family transcriptional regulator [Vineibacter sp.]|nr:RecX family transcriptional regulator [Vineibacter sp.]